MTDERQYHHSPLTPQVLVITGVLLLAMLGLSIVAYFQLPADARVPSHWNFAGEADAYAGRLQGLFLLPGATIAIVAVLMAVPRIDPRRANLLRSAIAYRALLVTIVVMFAALHALAVATALGRDVDGARLIPLGVGLLLIVVGNYLPKLRSNWFMGIRTPWTLSSERSWRRTHRAGGWLFVALGLALVLAATLAPQAAVFSVLGAGAAAGVAGLAVYSYIEWRHDPARQES